jgi:purine-binding chemotaxis protein CheW
MMRSYLICESVSVRYAIKVENVEGVYWLPQLSPIEAAPPWFVGSVNWHGEVVHVLDLGLRFKHQKRKYTQITQLIFVSTDAMRVGIVVDAVMGLIEVSETSVSVRNVLMPIDFNPAYAALIEGEIQYKDEIYLLLNLQRLLTVEVGQEADQSGCQTKFDLIEYSASVDGIKQKERMHQFPSLIVNQDNENKLGYALVVIGGVQYAIEVQCIVEFMYLKPFAVLPCCPDYLMGVMNLRGEILSVIDMGSLLNSHEVNEKKYLVILIFQSMKLALALQQIICLQYVDKHLVTDIQNIDDQRVRCKSLLKVEKGIAGILDIDAIFNSDLIYPVRS